MGIADGVFKPNRLWRLIAANDIGHIKGMRSLDPPATDDEVRQVRMMDMTAQGITRDDMETSRRDAQKVQTLCKGRLCVVNASSDRTGLVAEFMEPFFGGPGYDNLLVIGLTEYGFFGIGDLVQILARANPESWFGGALPESGFWGCKIESVDALPQKLLEVELGA